MRRLRSTLPAITLALGAIALPTAAADAATHGHACSGAYAAPSAANAAKISHATLCLLNRQRARHGLPRLRQQRSLAHAAANYARLMVRQRFFDHVSPGGSTMTQRIERTSYLRGVRGWSIGENLAWGAGSAGAPARIVNAWMHSAGHRRNILDSHFREIGIGIAAGAPVGGGASVPGGTYATEFGVRQL
jgi:uncharacterized protein YkwD